MTPSNMKPTGTNSASQALDALYYWNLNLWISKTSIGAD